MRKTTNYQLNMPDGTDTVDIEILNANAAAIDAALKGLSDEKEAKLSGAAAKTTLADADALPLLDSAANSATKRITFANLITAVKAKLGTVYAALSHTHTRSDIADFPASMTPTAHTHETGDITSGTLKSARLPTVPLNKGGTNATTAAEARTNLGALGAFPPVNITISATWSGSGPWTQRVAVSGVKAAWDWRLGLHLAKITDDASRKLQEKAMMCITWCETYDGGITLTCRDKKPDVAIQAVLSGEV